MEVLLTVIDVAERLRQVYELVDAIRRQRSQNRETYIRLMRIYVELQSEPVRANPTLKRTQAIETFEAAVDLFYKHLTKYNDMHRVVRIFKWSKMEDSRLEVVKEVDRLLQMLDLATTVATMEGQAAAAFNSEKLFAKLKGMHKDIQLGHDQILAKLQTDRQRPQVMEKEDVVERGVTRQAPIPKNYGRALSGKKLSIRDEDLEETEVESELEDKTPVESEENEAEDFQIFSFSSRCRETQPIGKESEQVELMQQATSEEEVKGKEEVVEEKEKLEEKKQQEKEEPTGQGAVDMKVVVEDKEQVAQEPVTEQPTIENVVENQQRQHEKKIDLELERMENSTTHVIMAATEDDKQEETKEKIKSLVQVEEKETDLKPESVLDGMSEVVVVEDEQEEDEEKKIEPLPQVTLELDENENEIVDPTLSPQLSSSSLLEDSSVPLLIKLLGSEEVTSYEVEEALLDLINKCVSNSNRVQVYKAKGIPALRDVVRTNESSLAQLYALHCLSWFTFSFSKVGEAEFEELQACVREPTHSEMLSLLRELQYGDEQEKEVAALRCSCLATRGDGETLRRVGVFPLLIDLLTNGTANQKLWATEALVTLASDSDESCMEITSEGAIPPLIALLRSGTDMQKQEAAYALGNLAANDATTRAKIAREGAIPPMVRFVKVGADSQNQGAVSALGFLSLNNEENRVLIAQEGAIPPLVELLKTGTRAQKQWSAYTLGNLAYSDANRVEITKQEAIGPLIELLRSGRAMQKQRAAFALGNLACDNEVGSEFDDAILPLVELVRVGSDTQKEDAAYTLGNLAANNDGRRVKIRREGAISPLVKLLRSGNDDQKQWAAFALRCLAHNNDENRVAIMDEGAVPLFAALVEGGTDEQKEQAAHALKHLTEEARKDFSAERIMTPLMGYLQGMMPLVRKLVAPDSEAQKKVAPARARVGKKKSLVADAW